MGGRSPPLKPAEVALFTMILYNSENSIRDIKPFSRPLFCHSSAVNLSLLQQWTRYETRVTNITEPPPLPYSLDPSLAVINFVATSMKQKSGCTGKILCFKSKCTIPTGIPNVGV